jgi:hypothetical protein
MAEAAEQLSSAVLLGSNEPTAGTTTTENQRKRTLDDVAVSPENINQLLEERKKSKTHETDQLNPVEQMTLPFEETCVSCAKIGS